MCRKRMTNEIDQGNDTERVADDLLYVLTGVVEGVVHRACFPQAGGGVFTGELLPIPFSATPVIAAKKFWFHRSTDFDLRVSAKYRF